MRTTVNGIPGYLFHYYEASRGPFRSLTMLPPVEAESILNELRSRNDLFASRRAQDYLAVRRELEDGVRELFIQKGGRPRLERPYYMVLGACPWLQSWYAHGRELRIALSVFEADAVSFTYGDTFPAMRYADGQPYRRQVYRLDEIPGLIRRYGLPQTWNPDGSKGPDRYIEAQVWDAAPIRKYLAKEE